MGSLKLNTLDVFTTELFVGNPLGLVHIPEGHPITETQKQQIAAELNYSETVFLHSSNTPGSYTAQIFTPKVELPFAGHPTIGTSVWIFENLEKSNALTLNIKAGPTKLTYDRAQGIASAFIPHNVRTHAKHMSWERVLAVQPALKAGPARDCPAVSIVQGMTFLLVDLSTTPELLNDVVLSNQPIMDSAELDDSSWAASSVLSLFYKMREGAVTKIQQRMITARVTEDPATGNASCALACYLSLKRGGAGETYEYEHDQGVEMGRASQIFTKITLDATGKAVESVELRGQAVEVISGSIHLPKAQ